MSATVEIAACEAGLPDYGSITWTDVTDSSMEASVSTGRTDELSTFGAGTLSLRMLIGEPVEIGMLIRLRAGTAVLFCGRVTRMTTEPRFGATFREIEATDLTEALAESALARSAYAKAVEADGPLRYWTLDSESGTYASSKARYTTGLVDGAHEGAMKFSEVYDWLREPGVAFPAGDFTIEFWIKTRFTVKKGLFAPVIAKAVYAFNAGAVDPVAVGVTSEGVLFSVGFTAKVSTVGIADGRTHHIACTYTASTGAMAIYIDGVDVTGGASAQPFYVWRADESDDLVIGYRDRGVFTVPFVGTVDEAALYGSKLTGDQIAAHHAIGSQGAVAVTLAERVADLFDLAGIDTSWINADASAEGTVVYTKPIGDSTLNDELQALAVTHGARIHSDESGRLSVYGFDRFAAPVAHYSDAGDALGYLAAGFALEQSRDDIANTVTASQVDGPTVTASDADSIGRYGTRSADLGAMRATSPGAVQTATERHLDRYKLPAERFRTISIAPLADPALWAAMTASTVSAVVTVTHDGTTADYVIEGVSHSIAPGSWTTSLALSPAPVDDFWRWGGSTLGTDTRWA